LGHVGPDRLRAEGLQHPSEGAELELCQVGFEVRVAHVAVQERSERAEWLPTLNLRFSFPFQILLLSTLVIRETVKNRGRFFLVSRFSEPVIQ
jgi:hypothetical protein